MNAGAYDQLITVEKNDYQSDNIGNQIENWTEYYKGYAYVNNLSGSEYWDAAQTEAEDTIKFQFRWHPLLAKINTKDYRLVFRGRCYNITAIDNVQYQDDTIKISGKALENLQ